ncbi:hypothetical protein CS562_09055 [Paenibacillus sp. LK1]|nr:hypothetical protein CS562_09055 [Paenibacillus sp. LK1]
MDILGTVYTFLVKNNEGKYFESSSITYRRKLNVFFEYLINECNLTDNNGEDILRGMDEKKFTASVIYYVEQYNIQFSSTVDNYLSVIYSYFRYIRDSFRIVNNIIDSEEKLKKLKGYITSKTKEYSLITRKQKSPINKDVYKEWIDYCDECINNPKNDLIKLIGYNKAFTDFVSAIITKLVLLTGLKIKCIKAITLKDYDFQLNMIKLNNFWIHLPNNYAKQIRKYLEIRNSVVNQDTESLFINIQGKSLISNASMFEVLEPVIGSKEAESVAKYVIMQQIKVGIPLGSIKKLTGFSYETILHCAELVEEECDINDQHEINRQLDSKLRAMALFDKL